MSTFSSQSYIFSADLVSPCPLAFKSIVGFSSDRNPCLHLAWSRGVLIDAVLTLSWRKAPESGCDLKRWTCCMITRAVLCHLWKRIKVYNETIWSGFNWTSDVSSNPEYHIAHLQTEFLDDERLRSFLLSKNEFPVTVHPSTHLYDIQYMFTVSITMLNIHFAVGRRHAYFLAIKRVLLSSGVTWYLFGEGPSPPMLGWAPPPPIMGWAPMLLKMCLVRKAIKFEEKSYSIRILMAPWALLVRWPLNRFGKVTPMLLRYVGTI